MKKLVYIISIACVGLFGCDKLVPEPTNVFSVVNDEFYGYSNQEIDLTILDNDLLNGDFVITVNTPQYGTIDVGDGSLVFKYTPKKFDSPSEVEYSYTDKFTYSACDEVRGCREGIINVRIETDPKECDDIFSAENDLFSLEPNSKVIFSIEKILANDLGCPGAVSKDNEFFDIMSVGQNGRMTKDGDILSYTPDAGYKGVDSFKYRIFSTANKNESRIGTVFFAVGVPYSLE